MAADLVSVNSNALNSTIEFLTAMVTPTLLISATGSLVLSGSLTFDQNLQESTRSYVTSRAAVIAIPPPPKQVSGNSCDHDCDADQRVPRIAVDSVDNNKPTDRDE